MFIGTFMPKVFTCAYCQKTIFGGTYTLIKHFNTHMTDYVEPKEGYTVYTKSNCKNCDDLKKSLPNATFVNCDIYLNDSDSFLDWMWSISKPEFPKTFPMVFKDKQYIGGSKDFHEKFSVHADF